MTMLGQAMREAQAFLQAHRAAPRRQTAAHVLDADLAQFWTAEAIGEYRAWRSGGPLPVTAGGLDLLATYIQVEDKV